MRLLVRSRPKRCFHSSNFSRVTRSLVDTAEKSHAIPMFKPFLALMAFHGLPQPACSKQTSHYNHRYYEKKTRTTPSVDVIGFIHVTIFVNLAWQGNFNPFPFHDFNPLGPRSGPAHPYPNTVHMEPLFTSDI